MYMKKRRFVTVVIAISLTVLMLLGAILNFWPQSAAQDSINIVLNGSPLQIPALLKDGRVLVPLDHICHYLQCSYEKDDSQKTINFIKNGNVPEPNASNGGNVNPNKLAHSDYQTLIDGLVLFIDTYVHNDIFYIDLEYLAQSFNVEAQWYSSENTMLLTEYPEEYAAEVNGEKVPMRLFNERYVAGMLKAMKQNEDEPLSEETIAQIKDAALGETVELVLTAQLARENGFVVDDSIRKKVNFYLESTVERYGGIEPFREYIQSQGVTYQDAINYFTYGVIKEEAIARLAEGVSPSEEMMREYYDANLQSFIKPAKAIVQHILLPTIDENENSYDDKKIEEQRLLAMQIKERLNAGEDFDTLRKEFSMDFFDDTASNPEGFEVVKGWLTIASVFEDAVFSLEPGQISDVVTTYRGFHIIKLISKTAEEQETFEEAREKISNDLQYSAMVNYYRDMLERKRENSVIKKLVN